ncbi:hypothetical protein [Salirhabdus salicampi]|uniref:hypothetical protein n=1 Tax=Salirhabdus salicampi TaxID=476102 RepID=UPI0020C37C3E|nr:hypothetical protein [Salirhabdus salicampi]MCP8616863.1 hypothetical protein [Salirhabdus salicampi]
MRLAFSILTIITGATILYKIRYKLLRYMISVGILRKLTAATIANLPSVRRKMMSFMFQRSASSS